MLPPSSASKNEAKQETSMKADGKQSSHAGFLLGLFFDPGDVGDMFSEMSVDFQRTRRRYIPEVFITTGVRTSSPTTRKMFTAKVIDKNESHFVLNTFFIRLTVFEI
jgi:hypothetical protein